MFPTDNQPIRNTATRCCTARVVCSFVALFLLVSFLPQQVHAKQARFTQPEFVIALWGDPPVDAEVNARYVTIKEAGFNVVLGGVGADAPEKARLQRDAAEAAKMKVIFSTYGLPVKMLCNCEATYGFLVRDHPVLDEFKKTNKRVKEIRLERPGKLPLINLYAPTTDPVELGAASYAAYLEACMARINPEVLCYDYMPSFAPEQDTRDAFCKNLAAMHQFAQQYNRPFWNFIKAMPYDSEDVPTDAQIRWQAWTSMAHGSQGLIYFAYWPPPDDMHVRGNGILTVEGELTPRYEFVKSFNTPLRTLGAVLMEMESSEVISDDFTMGTFSGGVYGEATLVVNNSLDAAKTKTLDVAREIDKTTGKAIAVVDADADTPGTQLHFEAGDARLFVK